MRRMYSLEQLKSLVKEEVESGSLENAKPIYCHPVSLTATTGNYANSRVICLIFNNDENALTKETFLALLGSFTGRLLLNGFLIMSTKSIIPSYVSGTTIVGFDVVANAIDNSISITSLVNDTDIVLTDNVNKIN